MNLLFLLIGIAMIGFVVVDALWTTLATGGGGPLTSYLAEGVWARSLTIHRSLRGGSHRLLQVAATLIMLITLATWILLLWGGWTFIFAADPASVIDGQSQLPVDMLGKIYFTGFTLFTLGMGNYIPSSGGWEILTAVTSINGLFLVTLSITYMVPVISAAAQKHQLAAVISDLGETPEDILIHAWDGKSVDALDNTFASLITMIELHNQRHLAYPVLHFFHSPERRTSLSTSLVVLDDALAMIQGGLPTDARPAHVLTQGLDRAIAGLFRTIDRNYRRSAVGVPPEPSLAALRHAGIHALDDTTFRAFLERRADRRCLAHSFLDEDGWSWPDHEKDAH